jgi:8-oxo-dGTP pyrophosphatase MutT (NUDIX family)
VPTEQFDLLPLGYGVTNAAYRTTPGSGDLRRGDFDAARLESIAEELQPRAIAFVGKEAYRGAFGERPELGPQGRTLGHTALYVLPSTSPANAAVPYDERLRWFRSLHEWLEPVQRPAVRALLVDERRRTLLFRWETAGHVWWITPGGGIDPGEDDETALRRELHEEVGLDGFALGPVVFERLNVLPYPPRITHQPERFYLVEVDGIKVAPTIDLAPEGVTGHRWWTLDELEATAERFSPIELPTLLRSL